MGDQLSLAVTLPQVSDFAGYEPGCNGDAVAVLERGESAYLFGPPDSGKTHLLLAAVQSHRGHYLPLSWAAQVGTRVLDVLDDEGPVAIDDVAWAAHSDALWQPMLRWLDQRQQRGRTTWLASRSSPERLHDLPADLRSRLGLWPRFGLQVLSEAHQRSLLLRLARRRGLLVPDEVVSWWMRRLPRDPASMLSNLERLDRASLRAQRRLTLPFVRAVLEALPDAPGAQTMPSH